MTVNIHKANIAFGERPLIPDHHQRFHFVIDVGFTPESEEDDIYIDDVLTGEVVRFIERMEKDYSLTRNGGGYTSDQLDSSIQEEDKEWLASLCEEYFCPPSSRDGLYTQCHLTVEGALSNLPTTMPIEQLHIVAVHWPEENPDEGGLIVANALRVLMNAMV